jgi:hypothetical protein
MGLLYEFVYVQAVKQFWPDDESGQRLLARCQILTGDEAPTIGRILGLTRPPTEEEGPRDNSELEFVPGLGSLPQPFATIHVNTLYG